MAWEPGWGDKAPFEPREEVCARRLVPSAPEEKSRAELSGAGSVHPRRGPAPHVCRCPLGHAPACAGGSRLSVSVCLCTSRVRLTHRGVFLSLFSGLSPRPRDGSVILTAFLLLFFFFLIANFGRRGLLWKISCIFSARLRGRRSRLPCSSLTHYLFKLWFSPAAASLRPAIGRGGSRRRAGAERHGGSAPSL